MSKKILVTSALPYANGPIHIGHMIEYIQTDIYVRFLKLTGKDAFYCCADDTHGTPIEINAKKHGKTPAEFIKHWLEEHKKDFASYNIQFDSYYSTNTPESRHYTELIFDRLNKKGLIYTKEMELTYCPHCKRFLPDRYVKGICPRCGAKDQYGDVCEKCNATYTPIDLIESKCVVCSSTPIRKNSTHYFFRLSEFSDSLKKWLTGNKRLQPEIRNQIMTWVRDGLEDWCISRDGPYFGFKIPGETNKYFYVWLDAPIGYISSTANYCKGKSFTADDIWQKDDSEIIHFIGKDIIYFHLLFWPAVLMGAEFHVPDNLVVHGFLTVNNEKMSKSRGTFLTAREFLDYCPPEFLRYYYAGSLTHSMTDIDLDLKHLVEKVNNELVANIANFMYRVLSFTEKNFNGKIGKTENKRLLDEVQAKAKEIKIYYNNYEFREAVKEILEIASIGNRYFQEREPWALIKTNKEETLRVLTDCVNIVKIMAVALKPITPVFSAEIEDQLNMKLAWSDAEKLTEKHTLGKSRIVLRKMEWINLEEKKQGDPFEKLNLKVAEIIDVSDHYKADKLLLLNINLGKEKRQLVAGLKPYYPEKENLIGKKIVVLTNLEHANLRGERSEGMLLAAETKDGRTVEVLEAPNSDPGEQVYIDSVTPGTDIIKFDDFLKVNIRIQDGKVMYKDKSLKTKKEMLQTSEVVSGSVR